MTYLDVDEFGVVNLEQLKQSIRDDTILITIMMANNEIGTIQPVDEIGTIAHAQDVYKRQSLKSGKSLILLEHGCRCAFHQSASIADSLSQSILNFSTACISPSFQVH